MQAQFPATYVNYIGLPDESRVKSVVKLFKATTTTRVAAAPIVLQHASASELEHNAVWHWHVLVINYISSSSRRPELQQLQLVAQQNPISCRCLGYSNNGLKQLARKKRMKKKQTQMTDGNVAGSRSSRTRTPISKQKQTKQDKPLIVYNNINTHL